MSDKFEMMDDEAKSLATRIAYRYTSNHSWLCDFVYDYNTLIDIDRFYYMRDRFDNYEVHYGDDTVLLVAAFLVKKNAVVITDVEKNPYFGEVLPIIQKMDPEFGIPRDNVGIVKIPIHKLEQNDTRLGCHIFAKTPPPDDLEKLANLKEDIQFILQPADYAVRDNEKYRKWIESGGDDYLHGFHWGRNSKIAYPCNRDFVI